MLHDCALAGDDVVVFDFPLTVRPARLRLFYVYARRPTEAPSEAVGPGRPA